MEAGFGAVFGLAIQWGVKRGIYSNEAGQGTSSTYCGSCKCFTSYKTRFSAVFSVYIDTLLVCSATGFMLLITGSTMYKIQILGQMEHPNINGAQNVSVGPGFTQKRYG
jgi:AGCS family alanine or glycine:cation symporter